MATAVEAMNVCGDDDDCNMFCDEKYDEFEDEYEESPDDIFVFEGGDRPLFPIMDEEAHKRLDAIIADPPAWLQDVQRYQSSWLLFAMPNRTIWSHDKGVSATAVGLRDCDRLDETSMLYQLLKAAYRLYFQFQNDSAMYDENESALYSDKFCRDIPVIQRIFTSVTHKLKGEGHSLYTQFHVALYLYISVHKTGFSDLRVNWYERFVAENELRTHFGKHISSIIFEHNMYDIPFCQLLAVDFPLWMHDPMLI